MGKRRYKLRRVADRPCIQVQWDGSGRWVSTGCRTMEDAKEWAESMAGAGRKVTFGSYAEDFFMKEGVGSKRMRDEMDNKSIRLGTYYGNQHDLDNYVVPFFRNIDIREITPKLIDEWKMWLRFKYRKSNGGRLASVTINKAIYRLSTVMDSAVYDEIIQYNPVKAVAKLGTSDTKPKPIWTEDELARLFPEDEGELAAIWSDVTYMMLCMTIYNTGFRPGEVCALKRSNIYRELNGIHTSEVIDWHTRTPYNAIKTSKKGKKYKVSIVSDRFMERLCDYMDSLPPEQEYLFLKPNGDYITSETIWLRLKQVCTRAGIPFHGPYTFRHNFITRKFNEFDEKTVFEMAGHTIYEACYDHRTPEMIIENLRGMMERSRKVPNKEI